MNFDLFLEKLKEASLSKEEFIKYTKVNPNTLKGWATERQGRKVPHWIVSWLELYINNKEKDIVIKALKR
ncbi:MAG: XRE family transcriptional regulator [Candidatus Marinarcus sp.]|uniref:XRE family transcriptional regulator n=1 Tax=Candidatus Marinarcus sp. TaxID=3100987 RepID=UPI003B007C79